MPQDTGLRQFRAEDLPAVYALVQNTIDVSYAGVYPEEAIRMFKEYHTGEAILNDAAAGCILVAEVDGIIAATGTLLAANVRRVFVGPPYQQRGLGLLLAQELEKEALTKKLASLDLSASLVSRRFWEARGFTFVREASLPACNGKKLVYFDMVKDLC